jgi:phospholipid/cholesterol/gamma-HCH transport system substrate-binding protein
MLLTTYNQLGEHTTALVDHFKKVDIRPTIDSVNYTLSNVNGLLARIQSNEGTIGALINDRSMYNNLNHTIQSADSLVTDIKAHPKRYVHFSVFGRKDK